MTFARRAGATGSRRSERGSALLIVFVFAAVIGIMLYRELPVAAFEARRTKEELLVSRGHEYQRAVQLYYRRFRGQYPASIEQLENTNNMRFLRRRYKDPFTGKDDWRLLHAGGPNGQLIDSKVTPAPQLGTNGQPGQNTAGAFGASTTGFGSNASTGFGSNSSTGFGSNSAGGFGSNSATGFASNSSTRFGSNTSNAASPSSNSSFGSFGGTADSGTTTEIPNVPKRAPVVDANTTSATGQTPTSAELNQDPSIPLLPASNTSDRNAAGVAPIGTAIQNSPDGTAAATGGQPTAATGSNTTQAAPGGPVAANGTRSISSTSGSTGRLNSGGLAGVASRAKGASIKKVNDQVDYSLWEFWYDPTKDTSMGNGGNLRNGAGGQNMPNGTTLGQPATGNGFGATPMQPTTTPTPTAPTSPDPNNPFQPSLPPASPGDNPQRAPLQPTLGIRPLQNQQQQPETPPNDSEPPADGNNPVPNTPPQPQSLPIPGRQ